MDILAPCQNLTSVSIARSIDTKFRAPAASKVFRMFIRVTTYNKKKEQKELNSTLPNL